MTSDGIVVQPGNIRLHLQLKNIEFYAYRVN
jgi:hypothetical protein